MRLERYEAYKDSGVEWIGEVPEEWEVKKLKYIIDKMQTGTTPSTANMNFFSGNINWFNPKDLNQSILKNSEKKVSLLAINLKEIKFFQGDSILIVGIGATTGKTSYLLDKATFNQQITGFKSFKNNNKYMFYSLKNSSIIFLEIANYTTLPILNNEFFKTYILPLPPLHEQIKIAYFLDQKTAQIDKGISLKEKLIEKLKEYRQILINDAVTKGLDKNVKMKDSGVEWIGEVPEHWEVKALKYILKERNERSETGDETLFMMSQTYGLVVRADYHDKAIVAQSSVGNKKVYKEDLVFNKLKAHLGVFAKSDISQVGLVSPDYAVYYAIGSIQDLKYLEFLFKTPSYISHFIQKATGIVEGLIRLYTDDLFSLKIPIPPCNEQKEILDFIYQQTAKIDKAINQQQKQIDKLKEYKVSLIDSVVTGKVRVL